MTSVANLLTIAGVDGSLHAEAIEFLGEAKRRASGLTWRKWWTRLFNAGEIADLLEWSDERLIDVDPSLRDWDIAPMINITAHGDNAPWAPNGRPVSGAWLNPDPESEEYKAAVASNYWCKGEHPRSHASRKAWYRRNAGEFRAWELGEPVDLDEGVLVWEGYRGKTEVMVMRCGSAWLIKSTRTLFGPLRIKSRMGFEIDNVVTQYGVQGWYPIAGYSLRAPVTWSVLPALKAD